MGNSITVTGALETTDISLGLVGGSATVAAQPTSIKRTSQTIVDMSINLTGTSTGEEVITIEPVDATSIFDAVGNAVAVTQSNNTVALNDKVLPTFTLVDISSNNSFKSTYAGENDIVSLNITASETINQPYVVFQSGNAAITNAAAITYSGSGNSWNAKYTVSSGDTNGAISFTIDASDNLGNNAIQVAETTNSRSVTKVGYSSIESTSTSTKAQLQRILGTTNSKFGGSVTCNQDGTILAVGPASGGNRTVYILSLIHI